MKAGEGRSKQEEQGLWKEPFGELVMSRKPVGEKTSPLTVRWRTGDGNVSVPVTRRLNTAKRRKH